MAFGNRAVYMEGGDSAKSGDGGGTNGEQEGE